MAYSESSEDRLTAMMAELESLKFSLEGSSREHSSDRLFESDLENGGSMFHKSGKEYQNGSSSKILYVSNRKLVNFRDRPQNAGDIDVTEWVADIRSHIVSRRLSADEASALIIDHLGGKARQEILGRGQYLRNNPEEIFAGSYQSIW